MITKRKWGYYITLFRTPWFAVKILRFLPRHAMSYQQHLYRNEYWICLYGYGLNKSGKKTRIMEFLSTWYIPVGKWHGFRALYEGCVILEFQWGTKVSESDIRRKE